MDENIPKQTVYLRDLPTKSLILYPTRAQVAREISNVSLQGGLNEIEIYGLGPMVDESSIQIDGSGQATITDITVDLVPNKEDFYEAFPKDDDVSEDEMDEPDWDESSDPKVRELDDKIADITRQHQEANDLYNNADRQLENLESYLENLHSKEVAATPASVAETLKVYQEERSRLHKLKNTATKDIGDLYRKLKESEYQKFQAEKGERLQRKKAKQEKERAKEKKLRQRQEKQREATRIQAEREKFWPSEVYRVVVRLEVTIGTPGTSRRNSLDSVTLSKASPEELDKITGESKITANLTLKYISESAFWTPRYDVSISSVNKTANIVYRAELSNETSETFKDCKIILSTSQTSFSGLDDKPPTMNQWTVGLQKSYVQNVDVLSGIAPSRNKEVHLAVKSAKKRKSALGGLGGSMVRNESRRMVSAPILNSAAPSGAIPPPQMQMMQQQERGANLDELVSRSGALGAAWGGYGGHGAPESILEEAEEEAIDFKGAEWEDSGLTATYELPGARTVVPSSTARRHKIAVLNASNIILSHIAVPKLRAAAFLRAKVKNPSNSVTLLKGDAGITLDGSFLGTIPLPLVSPLQSFTIPLGVDAAIHINYPKPGVHRSTQGIFSKENSHVFTRAIYINNTKPMPIDLMVLDQAPISQDERLRVEVLQPKGLNKENDSVRTGGPTVEGKTGWGSAIATRKKAGEICWTIKVEKSQSCVMKFDYEAKLPTNESVYNV